MTYFLCGLFVGAALGAVTLGALIAHRQPRTPSDFGELSGEFIAADELKITRAGIEVRP